MNTEKYLAIASDVVAAVSLISSLISDVDEIVSLFEAEDLSEEEVTAILIANRSKILSRIEGDSDD